MGKYLIEMRHMHDYLEMHEVLLSNMTSRFKKEYGPKHGQR